MNEKELNYVYSLLQMLAPATNKMNLTAVGSLICMLSEEWCSANDSDVVEFADMIKNMVVQINDEYGKY